MPAPRDVSWQLFSWILQKIPERGPVLVLGPKGFGKSEALDVLEASVKEADTRKTLGFDVAPDCSRLDLRTPFATWDRLTESTSHDGPRLILIDDLEILLARGGVGGEPTSEQVANALSRILSNAQARSSDTVIRVMATSSISKEFFPIESEVLSDAFSLVKQVPLYREPTELWLENIQAAVSAVVNEHDEAELLLGSQRTPARKLIDLWSRATLDASGGHPALMLASILGLQELLAQGQKLPSTESDESSLEAAVEAFVREVMSHEGCRPIRRQLRRLIEQDKPDSRKAIEALKRVVSKDGDFALPAIEAALLTQAGAILPSGTAFPPSYYRITSDVVRQAVEEVLSSVAIHPTAPLRIVADTRREDRGQVMEVGESGEFRKGVALSGKQWELLQVLYNARGKWVSLEEIAEALEQDDPGTATRSTINRLRKQLHTAFEEHDLIQNAFSRGYRLNTDKFAD